MKGDIKTRTRRSGADMGQALLYGAFAIAILIGVLSVMSVVQASNTRREYVNVITIGSNSVRQYFNSHEYTGGFEGFTRYLFDNGDIPDKYRGVGNNPQLDGAVDDTHIKLPYGGMLEFIGGVHDEPSFKSNKFMATMFWEQSTRKTRYLCRFLANGEDDFWSDIMGAEGRFYDGLFGYNYRYAVVNCDNDYNPFVIVNYM